MQRIPSCHVRGLYIYSPIGTMCLFHFTSSQLPKYSKNSIKYSEQSQIKKRKCIVKAPIPSPLLVSTEEDTCYWWDPSSTPVSLPVPLNPQVRPGFCVDSQPESLFYLMSFPVPGMWHSRLSPVCSECPCPAKCSSWLHLCWLQV